MYYIKNILIIFFFVFIGTGCRSVEYVENSKLSSDSDHSYGGNIGTAKRFGGIVQQDTIDSETGKIIKGREIVFKKYKSKYIAETLFFDNSNKPKSTFKKSYISFGADRKNKKIGFQITFIY